MRVIAGSLRGMKLSAPEGLTTRPTLDRVKEAVFSMLMPHINKATVLDLFAGSGSMGLEALSRGAEKAFFVDKDKAAIECIKKNIFSGKLEDKSKIIFDDAFRYLSACDEKFDLIFLDPPYFENVYYDALDLIYKRDILSKNGIIIVEWDYENGFINNTKFETAKEKKYGRVGITTLKRGFN